MVYKSQLRHLVVCNISFIDEDGKLSKDIVDNVINTVIEETDVLMHLV